MRPGFFIDINGGEEYIFFDKSSHASKPYIMSTVSNSHYGFITRRLINPKPRIDRVAYMHEYAHLFDFYGRANEILNFFTSDPAQPQDLCVERFSQEKTDDQIWDDKKILNCQPNMLIDRLIEFSLFGKDNFPLIIGYFNDEPFVVEPGVKDKLECQLIARGPHIPGTYLLYELKKFVDL